MYPRPFGRIYVGLEFFTSNIEVSCPTTDPSEAQKLKSQYGGWSHQPSNPRSEFSVQLFRHFPNRNVFGDPDHQPTFPPLLLLLRFPPDVEFGRPGSIGRAAAAVAAAVASASARAKNKIRQKKLEKPRTFPE